MRQQVDRESRPIGENHFALRTGAQESCYALTRTLISFRRRLRPSMDALMHIHARLNFKSAQGADYDLRHLSRRRIVQIMKLWIGKTREMQLQGGGVARQIWGSSHHPWRLIFLPFKYLNIQSSQNL